MKLFWNYLRLTVSLVFLLIQAESVCFSAELAASGRGTVTSISDPVKSLSEVVNSSAVSFSYDYEATKDQGTMIGKGSAIVQGNAYRMEVDGIEFLCDGSVRWTIDHNSKEVVVEDVDADAVDYYSNPILLIASADIMFDRIASESVLFNGGQALRVNLKPRSECGLNEVSLFFRHGDKLAGAFAKADDGTETTIFISDFRTIEKKDLSSFIFDDKSLDSSWIVTDLR